MWMKAFRLGQSNVDLYDAKRRSRNVQDPRTTIQTRHGMRIKTTIHRNASTYTNMRRKLSEENDDDAFVLDIDNISENIYPALDTFANRRKANIYFNFTTTNVGNKDCVFTMRESFFIDHYKFLRRKVSEKVVTFNFFTNECLVLHSTSENNVLINRVLLNSFPSTGFSETQEMFSVTDILSRSGAVISNANNLLEGFAFSLNTPLSVPSSLQSFDTTRFISNSVSQAISLTETLTNGLNEIYGALAEEVDALNTIPVDCFTQPTSIPTFMSASQRFITTPSAPPSPSNPSVSVVASSQANVKFLTECGAKDAVMTIVDSLKSLKSKFKRPNARRQAMKPMESFSSGCINNWIHYLVTF